MKVNLERKSGMGTVNIDDLMPVMPGFLWDLVGMAMWSG